MRGGHEWAGVLVIPFLLGAVGFPSAGSAGESRGPVRSVIEQRHHNVVLQEWDLSCGAAALATVLRYQHGEPVTERSVALGLIARPEYVTDPRIVRLRQGFSFLDMTRYVAELGYEGIGLGRMSFEDLLEHAPIIVPVDLRGQPHFVVFRGATRRHVLVVDPAFGNLTMTKETFLDAWVDYGSDVGRVGLVVRKGDAPEDSGDLSPHPSEFVMLR